MDDRNRELSPWYELRDPLPSSPLHAAAPDGDDDHGIDFRRYWRVFLKHRLLIATLVVAVTGLVAVHVYTTRNLYTAEATIQIEREAPKLAPVEGVEFMDSGDYDFYQTQYRVIRSRSIAADVIQRLGLDRDERFAGAAARRPPDESASRAANGVPQSLVSSYLGALSVDPVRSSRLVRVGFTSPSPELAAMVANEHVEAYTRAILEQKQGMGGRAKDFLEEELAKTKDRLVAAEAALNRFRKEKGIIGLDGEESDVVTAGYVDLSGRLAEARAERIALESQYRLVKERRYASIPAVADDMTYRTLSEKLREAEARRVELDEMFKPAYPRLKEAIAKEGEIRAQLARHVRDIVSVIESRYLEAKSHEEMLREQLQAQRGDVLDQKDVSAEYQTLRREVATAQDLYSNLLQRLKDLDVADEVQVSNVWVVDPALVPGSPSSPNRRRSLAIAAVASFLLGVGLALFLERLDDTVKTPDDVSGRLRLPALGVVPSFELARAGGYGAYGYGAGRSRRKARQKAAEDGNGSASKGELVVGWSPRSSVAEAYRSIRTAVLLSSADTPPRVVVVTSPSAGEGKTVTAVNHALALAQAGARVLLVDGDIRRPRLHSIFRLPDGAGLSTFLTGQCELDSVIFTPNGDTAVGPAGGAELFGELHVLPSGPLPPNPAELLGSRKMRDTLAGLRERYDYVVVDTPPVLPVTDAVLLATMSDGVLIVVRGQKTPVEVVGKCRDRLVFARARILGVVLNDVDVTGGDYYRYRRYHYGYHDGGGYGYGEPPAAPGKARTETGTPTGT